MEPEDKKPSEEKKTHTIVKVESSQSDVVWALVLIFVGLTFFANTTGLLPWSVWGYLIRYWPVFLILVGLQMLLGKSRISNLVMILVTIMTFVFIGVTTIMVSNADLLKNTGITLPTWWVDISKDTGTQINETTTIDEDAYSNVEKRELTFDIGAARLEVNSNDSTDFFALDASFYENFGVPRLSESKESKTLEISLKQKEGTYFGVPSETPSYLVELGQSDLSTEVKLDLGVGSAELTFEELNLSNMDLEVGAGQLTITLDEDAIPSDKLMVDVGTGQATLTIPEDVGYKVTYDVGVGSAKIGDIDVSGLGNEDENIESDNYNDAETTLDLIVEVGVGEFELKVK